jgi:hypothetical protein
MHGLPDPAIERTICQTMKFALGLLLALVAGCSAPGASPSNVAPSQSPTSSIAVATILTPGPTPAPNHGPSFICVPFADPLPSSLADPCPAVLALVQRVAAAGGLPVARILIEPGFFCGDPWQVNGSPPPCSGPSGLDGIGMHGWVTFVGSDKVMAIMTSLQGGPTCIEKLCGSSLPSFPPTWVASVADGGPPAGWVMPSP